MAKKIVVIGASFAGIAAVKAIFALEISDLEVTVISPIDQFFFNVAAPRLLVQQELTSQAFFPLEKILKGVSKGKNVTFVKGKATSVNFDQNHLEISSSEGPETLNYDILIIASGSRTEIRAFKYFDDHDETMDSLKKNRDDLKRAKSIAVVGGGAVGVETSGELGYFYGKDKKIVMYAGKKGPLSKWEVKITDDVISQLEKLNVSVVLDNASFEKHNEEWKVKTAKALENFEVVIPARGVKPNSDYLDRKVLTDDGYLKTNSRLQVEEYPNVLGLGDIIELSVNSIVDIEQNQISVLKASLKALISGTNSNVDYVRRSTTEVVPISRNGGVGLLFGWKIPSLLVWLIKSRDFFLSRAKSQFGY